MSPGLKNSKLIYGMGQQQKVCLSSITTLDNQAKIIILIKSVIQKIFDPKLHKVKACHRCLFGWQRPPIKEMIITYQRSIQECFSSNFFCSHIQIVSYSNFKSSRIQINTLDTGYSYCQSPPQCQFFQLKKISVSSAVEYRSRGPQEMISYTNIWQVRVASQLFCFKDTLHSLTGKYRDLQGNPCNENRGFCNKTGFSLSELTYREFPESLTGFGFAVQASRKQNN